MKSLVQGMFQITADQLEELRRETDRLSSNAPDSRLLDSDRIALLQQAVDRQQLAYPDTQPLSHRLIRKRAWYSACYGGIFAMPGMIPGIGTVAQLVFGFATTIPETDLVRHQMWCLYVELAHVYGRSVGTEDLDFLREEWRLFQQVNRGEEVFKQTATRQVSRWLSRLRLHQKLQPMLLRLGLPQAAIKSLGKSIPFAVGMAVGAMVNARRIHRFSQSVLEFWNVEVQPESLVIWEEEALDHQEPG